jgi:dTDP-4-dehydrorhamnose reductase
MIWIAGSGGMLGSELVRQMKVRGIEHVGTDRGVDLTKPSSIGAFLHFGSTRPSWIIDCAAYSDAERAEKDPDRVFAANADAARNLAEAAREVGASLLYVSCADVFGGDSRGPHLEEEAPRPQSVYGLSKLDGEHAVRRVLAQHVVLRTGWLYGRGRINIVDRLRARLASAGRLEAAVDRTGTPTAAADLAVAIIRIVGSAKTHFGIYHFTADGFTTLYELAWALYVEMLNRGTAVPGVKIEPVRGRDTGDVVRPRDSTLGLERIRETYGITPRDWREALREYLDEAPETAPQLAAHAAAHHAA